MPLNEASTQLLTLPQLRMGDTVLTNQQFFAVQREFDAQGVKLIWIETPSDAPEWDGVRDRLQRASAA